MALFDLLRSLPIAFSFAAVCLSLILMFYGFRYFYANGIGDISRMLSFAIPSLWMMMLAIYLWLMGREDPHER
ncbi:MAG: hypothetical protein ABH863_00630 [Candidatus Micrarchaeota archaeon]